MLLILLQDNLPTVAETASVLCTAGLCCIGTSCYVPSLFPFTADQLIGASGEQLSFATYWIMWGLIITYHAILMVGHPSVCFDNVVKAVSFQHKLLWIL